VGTSGQTAAWVSVARAREELIVLEDAVLANAMGRDLPARDRVEAFDALHERLGCPGRIDPWPCLGEDRKPSRQESVAVFSRKRSQAPEHVPHTLERLGVRLRRRQPCTRFRIGRRLQAGHGTSLGD
jgi:hypothetical protein